MRKFITSKDIDALLREGKKELVLGEEDQMTDLVREMIRRRGIQVVRASEQIRTAASTIPTPPTIPAPSRHFR